MYTKFYLPTVCQEPREFNLFLQTQLNWNQRKSVKANGLFPSIDELVDVFFKGKLTIY